MEAFLQTLTGGLLALAGALTGPFLQRRHDRWLAKRGDENILRDKAQELFDELDRISSQSGKASMSTISRLNKEANNAIVPIPELGRVRAITAIYFPSAMDIVTKFEADHVQLMQSVGQEAAQYVLEGQAGLEKLKALPMRATSEHLKLTLKLTKEMREHISGVVPKLQH